MHFAKLLFPAGISADFFGHMAYAMCPFFFCPFFNLYLFITCIYATIIKYFIYFFQFLYGICCTHFVSQGAIYNHVSVFNELVTLLRALFLCA